VAIPLAPRFKSLGNRLAFIDLPSTAAGDRVLAVLPEIEVHVPVFSLRETSVSGFRVGNEDKSAYVRGKEIHKPLQYRLNRYRVLNSTSH